MSLTAIISRAWSSIRSSLRQRCCLAGNVVVDRFQSTASYLFQLNAENGRHFPFVKRTATTRQHSIRAVAASEPRVASLSAGLRFCECANSAISAAAI
mgnify:CR=1 FL=1